MLTIRATVNGETYIFRTNDSGDYLFTGASENSQLTCDGGYNSLRKMRRAIREHLCGVFRCDIDGSELGRISYKPGRGFSK
jgi:hypothetical protein